MALFIVYGLAQLLYCQRGFSSVFHKYVFGWAPFITIFNNLLAFMEIFLTSKELIEVVSQASQLK